MTTAIGLPLTGYRVLVTRARAQAGAMTEQLGQLGATVVELPAIEIVPADPAQLDAAIRELTRYDWIVFTSANSVSAFVERLRSVGLNAPALSSVQVGAIGGATAERLREYSIRVDFVPERFIAESVVAELVARSIAGKRVLLPQAAIARDTVADGLRQAGANVDVVVAYRTTSPVESDVGEAQRLVDGADIVTFASPSAVYNLIALAGSNLAEKCVVCIGPVTAGAAREAGLTVAATAGEYSIAGLIEAVVRLVESEKEQGVPDENHSR